MFLESKKRAQLSYIVLKALLLLLLLLIILVNQLSNWVHILFRSSSTLKLVNMHFFTTSLIWFGGQFWRKVFQSPPDRSCGGPIHDAPYQVQRQSPLNQLTIGGWHTFYKRWQFLFYRSILYNWIKFNLNIFYYDIEIYLKSVELPIIMLSYWSSIIAT
jgi:hypothetical protein